MSWQTAWSLGGLATLCCLALTQGRPPNYSQDDMPATSFSCRDKLVGGYYADPETDCQMFHVCVKVAGVGLQDFRFLCPNDTAFDQENQICDDWYNIDCEAATLYYSDNFDLYRIGHGDGGVGADFAASKATPIPLGPSTIAPRPHPKPRRPHQPVNNAVGDVHDDLYRDDGDVSNDLLRGSQSGSFFSNRNNGKEDDEELHEAARQQDLVRSGGQLRKKNKVAVRKLLTGKRPVSQQASQAQPQDNFYQAVQPSSTPVPRLRYNTVNRNWVSSTEPASISYPTPAAPNDQPFDNFARINAGSKRRGNTNHFGKTETTTGLHQESTQNYNSPTINYNNHFNRQLGYHQQSTSAPTYNNYQNKFQDTTAAPTFNNQPNYNQGQSLYSSTADPFVKTTKHYQDYNQQPTTQKPNYYQNYNSQTSSKPNYYQNTQTTVNQNYRAQTTQAPNYYQTFTQTTAKPNYYQQSTNYPLETTVKALSSTQKPNYYQNQGQNNYNAQTTTNTNYYQYNQQPTSTTVNYDQYYQTSTEKQNYYQTDKTTTYNYYSSTPANFQNYYEKTANNNYQTKKQYNYNIDVQKTGSAVYDPYSSYQNNQDKIYDEPSNGEFLKTAPSSNIRPSDLNALSVYNKAGGFNTSVSSSYGFEKSTQRPTTNWYTTGKGAYASKSATNKPSSVIVPFHQTLATTQKPRPFSNPTTSKPAAPAKADYDYAYYDEGASEYDGFEPIGEEFSRTKAKKRETRK